MTALSPSSRSRLALQIPPVAAQLPPYLVGRHDVWLPVGVPWRLGVEAVPAAEVVAVPWDGSSYGLLGIVRSWRQGEASLQEVFGNNDAQAEVRASIALHPESEIAGALAKHFGISSKAPMLRGEPRALGYRLLAAELSHAMLALRQIEDGRAPLAITDRDVLGGLRWATQVEFAKERTAQTAPVAELC